MARKVVDFQGLLLGAFYVPVFGPGSLTCAARVPIFGPKIWTPSRGQKHYSDCNYLCPLLWRPVALELWSGSMNVCWVVLPRKTRQDQVTHSRRMKSSSKQICAHAEEADTVTAKVFMRPREEINDGLVQRSWSAYHPYSLISNYSFFGSVHDLAAASRITNFSQIPQLPWHKFIPPMFLNAWHKFLKVIFNFKSTFREKDNAIFAVLPLFHDPRVRLPFRLITPQEAAIISGISRSFAHAKSFPFLKSEFVILSAVGNSFHPALISAHTTASRVVVRIVFRCPECC